MPLAVKNNAIIIKDGKLAENCGCCCPCKFFRAFDGSCKYYKYLTAYDNDLCSIDSVPPYVRFPLPGDVFFSGIDSSWSNDGYYKLEAIGCGNGLVVESERWYAIPGNNNATSFFGGGDRPGTHNVGKVIPVVPYQPGSVVSGRDPATVRNIGGCSSATRYFYIELSEEVTDLDELKECEACVCPDRCTIGMQFVEPSQADIGVCGPSCVAVGGTNPACPRVAKQISDSGSETSVPGRVVVSYTTTLNAVNDSTNFANGVVKSVQRLFTDGLRKSVYATLGLRFIYRCDTSYLPSLRALAVLQIDQYEGFSEGTFKIASRSFSRSASITIDPSAYRCSSSTGRLCSNSYPGDKPCLTKEFLPETAVFDFSQTAINGTPLVETSSNQFGDQTEISKMYNDHFAGFTAKLVLSERNTCNPLP
jgi:hypothetical protein